MRHATTLTYVLIAAACVVPVHAGDVYKCKGSDGVTKFQQIPCSDPARTQDRFHFKNGTGSESELVRQQAAAGLIYMHPDVAYGSNVTLLNDAIQEVAKPGMSSWTIYERAYERASQAPTWQHRRVTGRGSSSAPANAVNQRTRPADIRDVADESRSPSCGLGQSRFSCGHIRAYQCTRPDGSVYYAVRCGSTSVRVGVEKQQKWRAYDKFTGRLIKDDLDIGHRMVFDPVSGRQLFAREMRWEMFIEEVPVFENVPDKRRAVHAEVACSNAQRIADRSNESRDRERAQVLCKMGRSMYDLQPSEGSLYERDP